MSDELSGYPGAPPGWYPDPAGGPGQRWWDGYAWTDSVVQPTLPPPPPNLPAPPPLGGPELGYPPPSGAPAYTAASGSGARELAQHELSISPIARVALAIPGLYYLVVLVNTRLHASDYRTLGHQYHLLLQAAQNNEPAPTINIPNGLYGGFFSVVIIFGLVTVAAIVIAAMWQFRAATTARALGIPARHSAGWGVGSWFVPIVSHWMPYQAIRDCLAPGDPHRPLVLRYWLWLTGTGVLALCSGIATSFSTGAGLVFAIPAALCALGVLSTATRVVDAITAAHRTAAGLAASETGVLGN